MKRYRVMKRGHSIGHHKLPYGKTITAKQLKLKDADLTAFVTAGILQIVQPQPPVIRDDAVTASEGDPAPQGKVK